MSTLRKRGVPLIILGRDLRISLKKPAAWAKTLGWPRQYPGPREEKGRSNMARSARRLPSPDGHRIKSPLLTLWGPLSARGWLFGCDLIIKKKKKSFL